MRDVLFVNHKKYRCGVYQYGLRTARIFCETKGRYRFLSAECSGPSDLLDIIPRFDLACIIPNYHPQTMSWFDGSLMREIAQSQFSRTGKTVRFASIVHDRNHGAYCHHDTVHAHISVDPYARTDEQNFRIGRPLPKGKCTAPPKGIVVGTFGFCSGAKKVTDLARKVASECPGATLRLLLPPWDFGDPEGIRARQQIMELSGLPLNIESCHDFLDEDDLTCWLAGNSINCFWYTTELGRGVASVIDNALTCQRPIGFNDCEAFSHLHAIKHLCLLETHTIPEIIANGNEHLKSYQCIWSWQSLRDDYEHIVTSIEYPPDRES